MKVQMEEILSLKLEHEVRIEFPCQGKETFLDEMILSSDEKKVFKKMARKCLCMCWGSVPSKQSR